jgi:hypothetical protein
MRAFLTLRPLLWLDAATCAATGLLLAGPTAFVSGLLGLPAVLLREAGIFLMLYAVFVGWAATRADPAGPARLVIAANFAWVIASFVLLLGPWVAPTLLGKAFIAVQAVAVAGLAALQQSAVTSSRNPSASS